MAAAFLAKKEAEKDLLLQRAFLCFLIRMITCCLTEPYRQVFAQSTVISHVVASASQLLLSSFAPDGGTAAYYVATRRQSSFDTNVINVFSSVL